MANQLAQYVRVGRSIALASATLTLTITPASAQALTLVTQRADLASNDQVDWASLGSAKPFNVLPYTFSATSEKGLGLTVEVPFLPPRTGITPPLVFQTLPSPGIATNFAKGDFVLFTGLDPTQFPAPGNPGPLSITFAHPVLAAGTQIAVDDTLSFQALVSAFDSQNTLLGRFGVDGTSSLALDNSAVFLGVQSDQPNIAKLVFSSSVPARAIGINALSIRDVAEPGSGLGLFVVGILGTRCFLKRPRSGRSHLD